MSNVYDLCLLVITSFPTVRFIYPLNEVGDIFEDDPDYGGRAYKTRCLLPNNKIGLIGVLSQANFEGIREGLSTRPLRVLCGIIQLFAGTILTACGLGLLF